MLQRQIIIVIAHWQHGSTGFRIFTSQHIINGILFSMLFILVVHNCILKNIPILIQCHSITVLMKHSYYPYEQNSLIHQLLMKNVLSVLRNHWSHSPDYSFS